MKDVSDDELVVEEYRWMKLDEMEDVELTMSWVMTEVDVKMMTG